LSQRKTEGPAGARRVEWSVQDRNDDLQMWNNEGTTVLPLAEARNVHGKGRGIGNWIELGQGRLAL